MSKIVIDTRLRKNGSIYDANIAFTNRGLQGKYRLLSCNIFNSFYNVNETNNLFHFNDGGGDKILEIPMGSYSITTLLSTIRNSLNSLGVLTWGLTFNTITYKTTITANGSFSVDFTQANSIGFDLGFNKQSYVRPSGSALVGESIIRLSLFPLAYHIRIKESSCQDFELTDSSSSNFVIPITTALQSQNYYETKDRQEQYITFNRECKTITLQVYDQDNRLVNLLSDYYLILEKCEGHEY